MENNVHTTAMPIIAGILNIISGAFKLVAILGLVFASYFMSMNDYYPRRMHPAAFLQRR